MKMTNYKKEHHSLVCQYMYNMQITGGLDGGLRNSVIIYSPLPQYDFFFRGTHK